METTKPQKTPPSGDINEKKVSSCDETKTNLQEGRSSIAESKKTRTADKIGATAEASTGVPVAVADSQAERYKKKMANFEEAGNRKDEEVSDGKNAAASSAVHAHGRRGTAQSGDDDESEDDEDEEELLPGAYAVPGPRYRGSALGDSLVAGGDSLVAGDNGRVTPTSDEMNPPSALTDQTFEGEVIEGTSATVGEEEDCVSPSAEGVSRSQSGTVVLSAEVMPNPTPTGGKGAVTLMPTVAVAKAEKEEVYAKRKRKRDRRFCAVAVLLVIILVVTVAVAVSLLSSSSSSDSSNGDFATVQESRLVRFKQIFTSFSDPQTLEQSDPPTPQYQALNWLANVDEKKVAVPTAPSANNSDATVVFYDVLQRYAAAVFYYSLGGPSWEEQLNFLSSEDECLWNMVGNDGLKCGKVDGNVNSDFFVITRILIDKDTTYLNGTIPEEISLFRQLESFSLATNDIRGTIPSSLGSLGATLSTLNLNGNLLTGTIPSSLSRLEKLSILQLNENQLTGTVPPSFAHLANLGFVFLQDNDLTGSLDFLCNETNPIDVFASDCSSKATRTVTCKCCTACFP